MFRVDKKSVRCSASSDRLGAWFQGPGTKRLEKACAQKSRLTSAVLLGGSFFLQGLGGHLLLLSALPVVYCISPVMTIPFQYSLIITRRAHLPTRHHQYHGSR